MSEVRTDKSRFLSKLRGDLVGEDIFGNELYVGDYIIYGSVAGSSAILKAGRIVRIHINPGPNSPEHKVTVVARAVTRQYNYQTRQVIWAVAPTAGVLRNLSSNVLLWKDPDPIAVAALGNLDI